MKENLFGKTIDQLGVIATKAGLPNYAARQIVDWLYRKDAQSLSAMTNLPRRARELLSASYGIERKPPVKATESTDGTKKYLFAAEKGGFVGSRLDPRGARGQLRLSVQVGCKMGCLFLHDWKQGFQGQLSAGEILNQYQSLPERAR